MVGRASCFYGLIEYLILVIRLNLGISGRVGMIPDFDGKCMIYSACFPVINRGTLGNIRDILNCSKAAIISDDVEVKG